MIRRKKSILVILFLMINISLSFAQTVKGRVLNAEKLAVAGIVLSLEGSNKQVTTNASGNFKFYNLKKGEYTLVSSDDQFRFEPITIKVKEDDINVGDVVVKDTKAATTGGDDNIAVVSIEDLQQITDDNAQSVSSVLSSSRDPFEEAAAFNLGTGRFRARGYNNEDTETFINGMAINDLDDGRLLFNSWGGLNDVTRAQTNVLSLRNNEFSFGGLRGATFIDMRASSQRVQTKLSYSNSNRSFAHRVMLTKSTGMQDNGWAYSYSVSKRWGNSGYIKGTHFDSYSYYAAIDRKLNDKHQLSLMVLGAPLRRGKTTAAVQEMYDIAGDNFYNANWGYQNGEVRNSREDRIDQPIVSLRHDFALSKSTKLMTAIGYQFGKNANTRLNWFRAADPRPDYYKNLPSAQDTEEAKAAVYNYLSSNESARQINWDAMYDANRINIETYNNVDGIAGNNVTGKSSAFVLEEQRFDTKKINFNTVLNAVLSNTFTLNAGINLLQENNHNFKILDDLLGGDFFPDFDNFAIRDFPGNADALQNDLNKPNRLVKKGDVYGYDYNINTSSYKTWAQLAMSGNKNDAFVAVQSDYVSFYREGHMKNGRFPESSFGKSAVNNFFTYAVKAGDTYKLDGRNYLYASAEYKTRAPFSRFAYTSARIRNEVINGLTTEKIMAVEAGYIFKWQKLRGRISAYATQFNDQIENTSFFHDDLFTFVNYITYDISKRHSGMELGLNYTVNPRISFEGALALGQYVYTNRPLAEITQDNSSKVVASGKTIYIKNYYVPGTPQTAGTIGINYNSPKFWWLNFNLNYFDKNYVDINPDRRTAQAVDLVDKNENRTKFYSIIDQEKLPSAITLDMFAGKSWKFNKYLLAVNLSVGNLLDKQDFATSGFEQGRYDYDTKQVSKFPNKYWYSFGRNYSLNINLSF
jgi:hypothetical protein